MILVVGMKRRAGAFSLPRHPRRTTYCVRCIRRGSRSMRGRPRRAETPSSAERKVDDLNASSSFWQEPAVNGSRGTVATAPAARPCAGRRKGARARRDSGDGLNKAGRAQPLDAHRRLLAPVFRRRRSRILIAPGQREGSGQRVAVDADAWRGLDRAPEPENRLVSCRVAPSAAYDFRLADAGGTDAFVGKE